MKKGISIVLILTLVLSLIPVSSLAHTLPKVFLNSIEQSLENKPYMENGFWMLPFKEVMDNLYIPVEFSEKEGKYIGYVDKWQIAVTPDSYKEEFDLVDIELENMTKGVDDDVYVQLEFFSKVYGSKVTSDENKISISIELPPKKEEAAMTFEEYLTTLPEPQLIFDMDDVFNHGEPEDTENRTVTVVDIAPDDRPEGTDFDKALQMYNKKKHPNNTFYNSRITLRLPVELQQDDILVMQFWVRSIQATHESGNSQFDVNFEHATTYFKMFECMDQMVGKEWTKMNCAFRVTEHLMPNGGTCGFRIGFFPQTLQFADFRLLNYGKTYNSEIYEPRSTAYISDDVSIYKERDDTYYGREEGALWREEAFKRIEKHRVRDIKVNVTDKEGNPVPDVKVNANMTRSEFHWGTMTQWNPTYNSTHITPRFNDLLLKHFNAVSEGNAIKKEYWEPYGATLNAQFAQDNRLYNRLHRLSNGGDTHTNEILWMGLEERVAMTPEEYVIDFANWASMRMYTWGQIFDEVDVRNEVTSHQAAEEYYGPKVVADTFKILNDISPDSILLVNEAGINGEEKRWDRAYEFRKILDAYMENGAPIDGVGFEAHFYFPLYPQISYNQMDYVLGDDMKYATWTEYDLDSTAKDPKVAADVEADFLRDAIIIAYSHPKTIGFHMWGFADPNHWRGNAPLYDWYFYQKKDAVKYWDEYVWDKWFTKTEGVTDENGTSLMRGHRGEYEISVDALGKSAKITLVVSDTGENTVNAVVTDEGIILTSSEEVNFEKKEIPLPLEAEYNERNKAELWKELYRSRVNEVVGTKGEDISFLGGNDFGISFFKDENREINDYVINQGESIIAKVPTTLDSGAVKIAMPDFKDIAMMCRIEGRQKDGEWKLIGKCDNLNPKYLTFDFPVDEVKLTVEGNGKVHINNIHISQKGWIR